MKKHTFKLRTARRGPEHIRIIVYAGFVEEGGTLAYSGSFVMRVDEWRAFGSLLLLGADAARGKLTVTMEESHTQGGQQ